MARVIRFKTGFFIRIVILLAGIWIISRFITLLMPEPRVQLTAPDEVDLYTLGDSTLVEVQTPLGKIQLKRTLFCLDIYNRKPLMVKSAFKRNVDYLYCVTVISAPQDSIPVLHRWVVEGQPTFERRMMVKGKNCRVWSRRHLMSKLPGEGRVEIILENGNILGSAVFKLL